MSSDRERAQAEMEIKYGVGATADHAALKMMERKDSLADAAKNMRASVGETWHPGEPDYCKPCDVWYPTNQASGGHCHGCKRAFATMPSFFKHIDREKTGYYQCQDDPMFITRKGERVDYEQNDKGYWYIPAPPDQEQPAHWAKQEKGKK